MSNKARIIFHGSFAPIMSAIRIGPEITRLTVDVPQSEQLNAVGLQALLQKPLKFTVEVDDRPASARIERADEIEAKQSKKKESGPYARFWNYMHKKGFATYPDLQQVLDCTPEHVWEQLHQEFGVETMSVVGPRQFEEWVQAKGISENLVSLSRLAEQQAARNESEP